MGSPCVHEAFFDSRRMAFSGGALACDADMSPVRKGESGQNQLLAGLFGRARDESAQGMSKYLLIFPAFNKIKKIAFVVFSQKVEQAAHISLARAL